MRLCTFIGSDQFSLLAAASSVTPTFDLLTTDFPVANFVCFEPGNRSDEATEVGRTSACLSDWGRARGPNTQSNFLIPFAS